MGEPMKAMNLVEYNRIIQELTRIETELGRNIDTTLWISDPHGAGERFVSILKGRFGLVWQTAFEALPKTITREKLDYLDRTIRKEKYITTDDYTMERQDVISSLVKIIRYKVQDIMDFDRIRGNINKDLRLIIENFILNFPVPNIVFENDRIADRVITALTKVVKQVILSRLIVLGDVFDRGDEPDKILRILMQNDIRPYVTYVWGNHDILWMGAAAGNKSLIAEALRISTRYDNLEFLRRLNIDLTRLTEFALKLYPGEITGSFKAKLDISKKMEKTLAIIQFKLEEKTIKQYPQLGMESRLNLDRLGEMLTKGDTEGLTDTHFPTIDPDNPGELTDEEREVIDDLALQFTSSEPIKRLMRYLFNEGKLYHINNYIMNVHALIPAPGRQIRHAQRQEGQGALRSPGEHHQGSGQDVSRGGTAGARSAGRYVLHVVRAQIALLRQTRHEDLRALLPQRQGHPQGKDPSLGREHQEEGVHGPYTAGVRGRAHRLRPHPGQRAQGRKDRQPRRQGHQYRRRLFRSLPCPGPFADPDSLLDLRHHPANGRRNHRRLGKKGAPQADVRAHRHLRQPEKSQGHLPRQGAHRAAQRAAQKAGKIQLTWRRLPEQ
jgi:hypothetical protein